MYKTMAVVRTAFLLFIIGYTIWISPVEIWGTSAVTFTRDALQRLNRAAWLAIAWIAFETVLAWIVLRFRKAPQADAPAPAETPPA